MKITKRQLKRIIREEKDRLLSEQPHHQMYDEDDELRQLGDYIKPLSDYSKEVDRIMKDMGLRYGQLAHLGTKARNIKELIKDLAKSFDSALDDIVRNRNLYRTPDGPVDTPERGDDR